MTLLVTLAIVIGMEGIVPTGPSQALSTVSTQHGGQHPHRHTVTLVALPLGWGIVIVTLPVGQQCVDTMPETVG